MPFPATRVPVTVRIAPGADPAGDPGSWSWVDITSSVRYSKRLGRMIHIEQGAPDEATRVEPSTCRLWLDNRAGNYTPRNPLGTYYGSLGRNTPIRVTIRRAEDTFNRAVSNGWGVSPLWGETWAVTGGSPSDYSVGSSKGVQSNTTVNTSRFSVLPVSAADGRMTAKITVPVLASGATICGRIALRYIDTSNHIFVEALITTTADVQLRLRTIIAGTSAVIYGPTSVGLTHTAGKQYGLLAEYVGTALRVKLWDAAGSVPSAWTADVSDPTIPTQAGGIACGSVLFNGNTNTLPVAISFDDVALDLDRFNGFVSSWPPRWDKSGRDATVPVEANGVLRRLGQGTPPAQSALRRAISRSEPVAYWPLEDGSHSTQAASALIGGSPLQLSAGQVKFAATQGPASSDALADFSSGGTMVGAVAGGGSTAWRVEFITKFPTIAAGEFLAVLQWNTGGTISVWEVSATTQGDGGLFVQYIDAVGGFGGPFVSNVAVDDGEWHHIRVDASQSGSNIALTVKLDGTTVITQTLTTQTMGAVSGVTINPTGTPNEMIPSMGHLAVWAPFNSTVDTVDAFNGYAGEFAHDRISRLCDEEGIAVTIPTVATGLGTPMGAQPVKALLDLLYECADADQGVLYESGFGLGYKPRASRYNRPVMMALDFAQGHIAEPPEPADDDYGLVNRVEVSRVNGSSVVAEDAESITSVGVYEDSVTVNLAEDSQLADHAAWRVHLG